MTLSKPRLPRFALAALLLAVAAEAAPSLAPSGATPTAAADFSPPHVPDEAELRASGWQPASAVAPVTAPVDWPELPVQRGAALVARDPSALPRPALRTGSGSPVPMPLAARLELLERRESESGPVLAWTPRIEARELAAGGAWVVNVDVPPERPEQVPDQADLQSAFRRAERRLATDAALAAARQRVTPDRRFRLEPPGPRELPPPRPSGLTLRPVATEVADDAVLLLVPGASWWRAELAPEALGQRTHRLGPEQVFAAGGRLFAAPRALADDAALELVAFEGPGLEPRELPFPRPKDSRWRCELQDLREREGRLEALVAVHDPRLRRGPEVGVSDSWAALLSFDGATWHEVQRLALPGDARALRLRFEGTDPALRLEHAGRLLARRGLASP